MSRAHVQQPEQQPEQAPDLRASSASGSAGEPRWLDEEEMRAWRGLIQLTSDVRAALDGELLAEFGFSEGDYAVLVSLSESPDRRMRMCDLAARLHLSPSGLTRRLDGLVRDGLVVREPSREDRRVSLAVLTEDGFARLERAAPVHVDGVRRHLLDHLTRAEIRELATAFEHVRDRRGLLTDPATPDPVTPDPVTP